MTKDLALCIYGNELNASHYLTTEDFLTVLQQRLERQLQA
jgi:isocitrate dehydrogenase